MKALWLENQKLTFREDIPVPQPQPDQALIRVRLAGICSTDLEMVRGYYPFKGILGHEFVGEVVEAGDPALKGKRVTGEINIVCGKCVTCLRGDTTHCENRATLGIRDYPGCFAEYLVLPLENLHCIPKNMSDEKAVFTEPLAAALEIQQQVQILPTDRILVVGAGRLGQLIAQTLALRGCDLHVVVRHAHQREILATHGIATLAKEQVTERTFDLAVEATGSPTGFELARKAVRPRGTIVLKSTYAGNLNINFSSIVVDEITLVGSRCGPFAPALKLLETDQVDPLLLISQCYPLTKGLDAIEHANQPGVFKILLKP